MNKNNQRVNSSNGGIYEETETEKDAVNHYFSYSTFHKKPPIPFVEKFVARIHLEEDGENKTKLTKVATITPKYQLDEETLEKFKVSGLALYKSVYDGLNKYLEDQQKQQLDQNKE